ncbi:Cof subfamily protein (haloacid dehalogenase superfamily) [Streptococcus saliviloxodontae]|uniref:Cof subfamily protein (Haloacid dehalogenase superfamily) n=2 Tax=Streptococcus saliviloxodontae TaxID=1349416 RepID=A0ABS2PNC6_9STRE|nr:Cof subfamily protein (haloacid dehalogenase superfamily) [Streptococcus saliviloxodontae]
MIALDLDGTLLHPDGYLSDTTIDTIQKVQELGHIVVIATGRPYRMAIDHYNTLKLKTPLISFNGSLTNIPKVKWDFEKSVRLDKRYLIDILKHKDDLEMDFIASEYRRHFYITMDHPETIQPALFGVDKISDSMRLFPEKITRNPNALLMQTRHQDKQELALEMKKRYNHELEVDSWGGPLNILECSPKGINKAYALNYLLETLGMSKQDLIAFGDEHNDTEMLALAQTGYAMKNASQTLLPYADQQLEYSNSEDGVAKELQKLFLF